MPAAGISAIDIPGYRVLGTLGQGGMASVYLAIQENFGREVALKLVSTRYRDDESFAARFMREARIVAQMRHSNIVSVYDVGNHEGQLFLSMELLEGDLKSRIGNGMNDVEAARICIAIASALNYAHDKGFLHRDIKPENVLFRSDGTPVLTDFGIARALQSAESMTQSGMLVGTPSYMSPEQARGEPVDQRTDIYALGVLFYELLTGAVPYKATSAVSTALKHISEPIPALPVPLKHWNPFIRKILAKHAAQRFQNCREVISALALMANITDVEDTGRTAIINAAEMASMARKKNKLPPPRQDNELAQLTNIKSAPRRPNFVLPVFLLALVAVVVAGFQYAGADLPFVASAVRQFEQLTQKSVAVNRENDAGSGVSAPIETPPAVTAEAKHKDTAELTPVVADPDELASATEQALAAQEPSAPEAESKEPVTATAAETAAEVPEEAVVVAPPRNEVTKKAEPINKPDRVIDSGDKVSATPAPPRKTPAPLISRQVEPFAPIIVPVERIAPAQLERFKQAFENKDLNGLRAISVVSAPNQQLAQTLFSHYNGIRLRLAGVVSVPATNEMRARFVIQELKNSQGQTVEPGEHWKTLPVTARVNALGKVLLYW